MSSDIWLRKNEINILKYLPSFLQKDNKFYTVNTAESQEHENVRLILNDLLDQLFIDTATWGLDYFENFLDITQQADDNYQMRRIRIKIILNAHNVSTVEFMTDLTNNFLSDNSAQIIEHNEEYWFEVCFNIDGLISFSLEDIREAIELYKPAHLGFKIVIYIISEILIEHEADIIQYINSGQNFWNIGSAIAPHWDGKFNWNGEIDWSGAKGDENWRENQTFIFEILAKTDSVEVFSVKHEADILCEIKLDLAVQAIHESGFSQHEDIRHIFWNLGAAKYTFWDGKFNWDGEIDWSGRNGDERYKDRQFLVMDVSSFEKSTGLFLETGHNAETTSSHALKQEIPISHADDITYSTGAKQTYKNSASANIRGSTGFSGLFLETGHNAETTSSHALKQEISAGHNLNYIYYTDSGVLQEASHAFIETASDAAAQKCAGTVKNLFDGSFCLDGAHAFEESYTIGDAQTENLCVFYYIDKDKNIKEGSLERL